MTDTNIIQRWLALEAADGPEEQVEDALAAVFQQLPVFDPGPALTRRVLRATWWSQAPSRWFGHPAVRAAVALCVIQGAMVLGLLPAVLAAATHSLGVPGAVSTAVSTALAGLGWAADALTVGGAVGQTLASFASHPALIATMAACLFCSAMGLVALLRVRRVYRLTHPGGGHA